MLINQIVQNVSVVAIVFLLGLLVELAIEEFRPRLALVPISIRRK